MTERIRTRCPSCGHDTLFIGNGGHLTCSLIGCRQPVVERAIDDLRAEVERLKEVISTLQGDAAKFCEGQNRNYRRAEALEAELAQCRKALGACVDALIVLSPDVWECVSLRNLKDSDTLYAWDVGRYRRMKAASEQARAALEATKAERGDGGGK